MSIATTALTRLDRLSPLPACPCRARFATPVSFSLVFPRDRHLLPLQQATPTHASADAYRWRIGAAFPGDAIAGNPSRDFRGCLGLDELLLVAEVLCVAPAVMCSIWVLASSAFTGALKGFHMSFGSNFFVLQYSLLVGAVVVGSMIRCRQWRRICRANKDGVVVGFVGRLEKVEEDIRSSATILRVLSKHLEKLDTRFRLTKKALKEPIRETAALAQKNSEATRALAIQEEILEKELREIQKILLGMQEQQQKQLELILALGKLGRFLDTKESSSEGSSATNNPISVKKELELETQSERHLG
ncbi:uncharacterized protein LOC121967339 [Zingiber officinale]|uniref:Uncharacterized protein n=1 Tax=Zingiber officinale TaxID=94328 RepID=A0A8J5LHD0_ZINOF|nr:uncharacterized protein LOC121967339 [Zingiber officinale]KAG6519152.1 hypothetical protein ZIOFF_022641 [Zingiber officinale]